MVEMTGLPQLLQIKSSCQLCGEEVKNLGQHLDYYCQKRAFPCPLCAIGVTLENVDSHLQTCLLEYNREEVASEYGSEYESEEDSEQEEETKV